MAKKVAFLLVTVMALLVLAGCVQSDGSVVAVSSQPSAWDNIMERGAIRVGAAQAPPWYSKDPQSEEWTGVGISLANVMADAMGVEVEVVETTWGNAVAGLQADQFDVMFVLDSTPARATSVDFTSSPLLYIGLAALHDDDLTVSSWSDLDKPEIELAVTQGTSMDAYLTENLPNASINRFPSNDESVAAFQSGRANAVVLFHPPLMIQQQKLGRGTITVPSPVFFTASSAGVRREADKTWRDYVSTTTMYLYNTGKTQQFYEEGLRNQGIDPSTVPPIMLEMFDN